MLTRDRSREYPGSRRTVTVPASAATLRILRHGAAPAYTVVKGWHEQLPRQLLLDQIGSGRLAGDRDLCVGRRMAPTQARRLLDMPARPLGAL
jgi:uncharacterized protein YqjF (DUF2071 family)